ncbi:MAG: M48 family metallopeptidase [Methylococcaceae bacterium]|jgi:predicted metal-dependent hydrolase|nr:M48 family metallopeptidase [Methylococcaceae bacterium]
MPAKDAFPVSIRRSQRARHVRLVVKPGGVELVVPPHVSEVQALIFMHRQRQWVERKLMEIRDRLNQDTHLREPLASGSTVPFQGREVPLVVRQLAGARLRIARAEDGPFEIALPASSSIPVDLQVRTALFSWVAKWMRIEADRLAHLYGHASGLLPRNIRVKRMKTRWGSCGPRNDINLNWILAFAPPSVLEYVVVHEICHIRHRNHSREYWALVTHCLPGWPREREWLKRQGGELLQRFA